MARGVTYVDKKTRDRVTVNAKIVVLAASCCETARIMLNSRAASSQTASPTQPVWWAVT